jgi:hypothetical protein
MIGIAVGLPSVREIVDEKYYPDLAGGVLESAGRLFKRSVKMYVYPGRDPSSGKIHTVETAPLPFPWQHLCAMLIELRRLEPIRRYNESYLTIFPQHVLAKIERNDPGWESMVPPTVAAMIKAKGLFSYPAAHDGKIARDKQPPIKTAAHSKPGLYLPLLWMRISRAKSRLSCRS